MIDSLSTSISTALSSMQQANNQVTSDAGNIANGTDVESSLVDLTAQKVQVQIDAKVIQTTNEMNKRLLDIFV